MRFRQIDDIKRYFDQHGSRYLLIFIVIYTFALLGRSVWTNFQLQKEADLLAEKIENIRTQNKNFENLILYYKSDSFREVEARRKLGLKKPDEKVMMISVQKFTNFDSEIEAQKNNVSSGESAIKYSNPILWWQYLSK